MSVNFGFNAARNAFLADALNKPKTTQPEANTEPKPVTFADRAAIMMARGIPVVPADPQSKVTHIGAKAATLDQQTIEQWNGRQPDYNCCAVAQAVSGGFWVLETDSSALADKYFAETGRKIPSDTLMVQVDGRTNRGHRYYRHTAASIAMGNIGQADAEGFSARCDNQYVLSPLSVHPSGGLYRIINDAPIAEAPDDFIEWLSKQRKPKTVATSDEDGGPILDGTRDDTLISIGGTLRRAGLTFDEIHGALSRINDERCAPPMQKEDIDRIAHSAARYAVGKDERPLIGGNVAGTAPVGKQTAVAEVNPSEWPTLFKSVGALEAGEIKFLIRNLLPEGTTFIGGLAGEGKTLIALSMAKALTTGRDFLGRKEFNVPEKTAVLYMVPESGGRAFRKRCEKFGIPNDRRLFLTRTISEGSTLKLTDARLLEAVRHLKPVVFLDTVVRFNESSDENNAAQNKQLADAILELRQAGAPAIVCLHHATKAMREQGMSLESVLRGTGDLAALCDATYGILRDDETYEGGAGPNEVDFQNVKARDFTPPMPMRLALTRRAGIGVSAVGDTAIAGAGLESIIDVTGDLGVVATGSRKMQQKDRLLKAISGQPDITLADLKEQTGIAIKTAVAILKKAGWHKPNFRGSQWTQERETLLASAATGIVSNADVEL